MAVPRQDQGPDRRADSVADGGLYLAIDQGGHASRAMVYDARGTLIAEAVRAIGVSRPRPDWVEHDGEAIVASIQGAVHDVARRLGPGAARRVVAAGLATQRSNTACWDRHSGGALAPVISWQDRRAHAWLRRFAGHELAVHRTTGLFLSAHYGISKLQWCREHVPAVQAAAGAGRLAWGPMASFLLFRLLNERPLLVDPANASRTLLLNLQTLDWDPGLLALFGMSAEALPVCVPSCHDFGTLPFGESEVPLRVTNGDQSAALYAYGAPRADTAYVNLGTGAFIQFGTGSRPLAAPCLLSGIVLHDGKVPSYVLEGTVNGAAGALVRYEQRFGMSEAEAEDHYDEWLAADEEPPLFLNGVSGLGAPYWIADFRSRFVGEGEDWQKLVAIGESIVFLLQVNLEAIGDAAPEPPRRLVVTGGLAAVAGLCQRLADLSGLPVYRPVDCEATARGTAYLAAGCPADWREPEAGRGCAADAIPGRRFEPRPAGELHARFARWRREMDAAVAACS